MVIRVHRLHLEDVIFVRLKGDLKSVATRVVDQLVVFVAAFDPNVIVAALSQQVLAMPVPHRTYQQKKAKSSLLQES